MPMKVASGPAYKIAEGIAHAGVVDIQLAKQWLACHIVLFGRLSSDTSGIEEPLCSILEDSFIPGEPAHYYFMPPEHPLGLREASWDEKEEVEVEVEGEKQEEEEEGVRG